MEKFTVKNLDLWYNDFKALKNINLGMQENSITAFIGPSGCGKSTLLKSLNRMNDLVEGCRITGEVLLDGEDIYYADGENTTKVINVNELNILGTHNYENVMAATGMALSLGVPMDKIVEVLKRFQAVEHRIEYVTEKRGVKVYNDSKGTNPDAAIKGICAMNRPTLLIGGGYDKQSEYDEWIESFGGKVKLLVLIGQTREKIAACARAHGFENIVLCDTFEEAIDTCYRNAVSGDAVLLSPACASWGMFKNYEERGRIFKEYVRALKED